MFPDLTFNHNSSPPPQASYIQRNTTFSWNADVLQHIIFAIYGATVRAIMRLLEKEKAKTKPHISSNKRKTFIKGIKYHASIAELGQVPYTLTLSIILGIISDIFHLQLLLEAFTLLFIPNIYMQLSKT